MTQYCLNKSFLFDDETFQITQISNSHAPIKLSATATRCLTVLIEHHGETVNKDRLIHECWGKFGMIVTEGSMWKNISQLRQIFQKLEIPYEVIITVPKLGYIFTSQMSIERVESPSCYVPDPAVVPLATEAPVITVKESDALSQNTLPLSPELKHSESKDGRLHTLVVKVIIVNILLAAGYAIWLYQNNILIYFNSETQYQRIAPLGDTQFYVKLPLNQKSSYVNEALTRFVQEKPQTSNGRQPKFVYINPVKMSSVSSYFLCDRAITDKNNGCTAYFSLRGEAIK